MISRCRVPYIVPFIYRSPCVSGSIISQISCHISHYSVLSEAPRYSLPRLGCSDIQERKRAIIAMVDGRLVYIYVYVRKCIGGNSLWPQVYTPMPTAPNSPAVRSTRPRAQTHGCTGSHKKGKPCPSERNALRTRALGVHCQFLFDERKPRTDNSCEQRSR